MRSGILDIEILVLACSAFGGKHCAAMDVLEVAVGESVSRLSLFIFFGIDSQMPLCEFTKPVLANDFILIFGAWLVFAPGVFVVRNRTSFVQQFLCVIEPALV
jgi:hypothetical protein